MQGEEYNAFYDFDSRVLAAVLLLNGSVSKVTYFAGCKVRATLLRA